MTGKRKIAVQRRETLEAIQDFAYDTGLFLWLDRKHKPTVISPTELRYLDTWNELDLVLLCDEPDGFFTEAFFVRSTADDSTGGLAARQSDIRIPLSIDDPAELTVELRKLLLGMGLVAR